MGRSANIPAQVFLVLFPAAVGCLLGSLLIDSDFVAGAFAGVVLTVAVVFALGGAVAPLLGTKKPLRSYRFLSSPGRSALSRQAYLVGLAVVLVVVHRALVLAGVPILALGVLAAAVGSAALVAIGLVYHLRSQPGWRHWSTFVFLFAGALAAGVSVALVAALGYGELLAKDGAGIITARALVLAGSVLLAASLLGRSLYLSDGGARTQEVWALTQGPRRREYLAVTGLITVAVLAAAAAFAWPWVTIASLVAAVAAQTLYWRLFFMTGVPLSWKAEVDWSLPSVVSGKEA